jgi:gamma-glutamyl-gamma-aminobutyrate hydrolase PuuD
MANGMKLVGIVPSTGYAKPSQEVMESAMSAAYAYASLINKFCADMKILPIIITENDKPSDYIDMISGLILAGGVAKHREEFLIQEEMSKNYIKTGRPTVDFYRLGINRGKNKWTTYNTEIFEFTMANLAAAKRVPTIGIDSGSHVGAIARGGKSDFILIPERPIMLHGQLNARHGVAVNPNHRTSETLRSTNIAEVLSLHTKTITIPSGTTPLLASGFSEDGLIEAIENKTGSFFLGLQWHPETAPNSSVAYSLVRNFCEML